MSRSHMVAGVASILSFLAVSVLVFSHLTQTLDAQLALVINHADYGSAFTSTMVFFSEYGREYFWIPVVALMLLLGNRDTKLFAIELAVLLAVGIVAGEVMKYVVFRPRPFEDVAAIVTRVPIDFDSSYPSGHALIVSIGAAFAVAKFKRRSVGAVLVLEAALVCYSRVYVGMHYPLDVAAGILLGVGIAGVGLAVLESYLGPLLTRIASLAAKLLRDGPLDV